MNEEKRVRDVQGLAERLRALEEDAFYEFADHFGPLFRAMFIRKGLSPGEAEDLAASCITDVIMAIRKYTALPDKTFDAWVFTIARNAVADWWKETAKRKGSLIELQLFGRVPNEKLYPRASVVAAVQEALYSVNCRDREIIFHRNMGGDKSYEEIGNELCITAGAARVRHNRALGRLKKILERDPRIKPLIEKFASGRRRIRDEGYPANVWLRGETLMAKKMNEIKSVSPPEWLSEALTESGMSRAFRDKCRQAAGAGLKRLRSELATETTSDLAPIYGSGRRVLLYSDEPILAKRLASVLCQVEGFAVLPTCSTIAGVMEQVAAGVPDLVLLDLTQEVTFGVLSELKHAMVGCKFVLWINTISTEAAFQAMGLGVRGILRKTLPTDLQVKCLQKVMAGELWFEKALTDSFLCAPSVALTRRERQLVSLLSLGLKNKEIATTLMISEGTVKVYLSRLFQKVGVKDRFELALFGLKNLTTGQLPVNEKGPRAGGSGKPGLRSLVLERAGAPTDSYRVPVGLRALGGRLLPN